MENSQNKRILLVTRPICPPWDEASKNFAFYLAKNIQNFKIGLLTKEILPDLPENVIQNPIYTSVNFNFWQKMILIKNLRKLQNDFDVFHYLFTPAKLNTFLIKRFINFKKIKSIQTIATLREDLYSDEEIKSLMFGDLIITYSDYAKNKLNKLGFQNVQRIYPGIDLEEYQKTEKDEELMEKNNIAKTDFVINFTGEYTRLGAIDLVVNSFIALSKSIPNAKLALAVRIKNKDDAEKKEEIIKKLEEKKLLEKVSFFDDGSYKMSDVYNLCDISIFPVQDMKGKFDVPLAVVEAMACEKPMIISDLPVLQEFANPENSVRIKVGDEKALVEAIIELYNNPEKRRKTGQAARAYVENNFDIKNIAQEYEKVYEQI